MRSGVPRAPALYHFFPGRPYVESEEGVGEVCAETYGPRRCQIRLALSPLRSGAAPIGAGQLSVHREPPIVARAHPFGCVCEAEAALVEVTGPVAGVRLDEILGTIDLIERRRRSANMWLELRAVLLPGHTDADRHIDLVAATLCQRLGPDIPLHLTTAGLEEGPERAERLEHVRWIAAANGLRWVYTDDATDPSGRCTWCPGCDALLLDHRGPISRIVGLRASRCAACGWHVPGRFPHEVREQ